MGGGVHRSFILLLGAVIICGIGMSLWIEQQHAGLGEAQTAHPLPGNSVVAQPPAQRDATLDVKPMEMPHPSVPVSVVVIGMISILGGVGWTMYQRSRYDVHVQPGDRPPHEPDVVLHAPALPTRSGGTAWLTPIADQRMPWSRTDVGDQRVWAVFQVVTQCLQGLDQQLVRTVAIATSPPECMSVDLWCRPGADHANTLGVLVDHVRSIEPTWEVLMQQSVVHLTVPPETVSCDTPPLLVPLLQQQRDTVPILHYVPLGSLRHLWITGPAACEVMHALLVDSMLDYLPTHLGVVVVGCEQECAVYGGSPHAVVPPMPPREALHIVYDRLKHGVCLPATRPLMIAAFDPDSALLALLQEIMTMPTTYPPVVHVVVAHTESVRPRKRSTPTLGVGEAINVSKSQADMDRRVVASRLQFDDASMSGITSALSIAEVQRAMTMLPRMRMPYVPTVFDA